MTALADLGPAISGAVSGSHGRLRGTYRGHPVEAWAGEADPGPSAESAATFVDVFYLQLGDMAGRDAWQCAGRPSLRPFRAPTFDVGVGGQPMPPLFKRLLSTPAPDPELAPRLRSAGVPQAVERLGRATSPFLPAVRYVPALRWPLPLDPAPTARAPAELTQQETLGALTCEIEVSGGSVPSADRFGELLEIAVEIAAINATVNPPPR